MDSVFIARQPIVTDSNRLYAHELLFRDFINNPEIDDPVHLNDFYATSRVAVNVLNQFGINRLVGSSSAFINADEQFIQSDFITMLPKERFVIEILESVKVDTSLVQRVKELRKMGYRFALDDVVFDADFLGEYEAILPFVEIVKIDIRLNRFESVKEMIAQLGSYGHLTFLAEKVETPQEYKAYRDAGCLLFQGYFFAKPLISEKKSLDPAKTALLELTGVLMDESSGPREIASAFEEAPDLSLQLLQFLNSAHFTFKSPIRSIPHAVSMIGKSDLLTWVYLLAYANGSAARIESSPLVALAGFRSRLLRKIARIKGEESQRQDMAAFMGTLSLADTLFEMPMEVLLNEIKIDDSIKSALLDSEGVFAAYLEIAKTIEEADLQGCIERARQIGIKTAELEVSILESY